MITFNTKNSTKHKRYDPLFLASKKHFISEPEKILSFGCSYVHGNNKLGECDLISTYFPESKIFGTDISNDVITKNIKKQYMLDNIRKNSQKNISYMLSNENNIKKNGPFDIIFCLSVLTNSILNNFIDKGSIKNSNDFFEFKKFEEIIGFFLNNLNKDGILVIYNSSYLLEDTKYSSLFNHISCPEIKNSGWAPKFKKNGDLLEYKRTPENLKILKNNPQDSVDIGTIYNNCIFKKI